MSGLGRGGGLRGRGFGRGRWFGGRGWLMFSKQIMAVNGRMEDDVVREG